jgi:hypothetical protein
MSSTQPAGRDSLSRDEAWSLDDLETSAPCLFPTLVDAGVPAQQEPITLEAVIARSDEITDLCTKHHISIASLLQTTWSIVMGGYTGATEILFGCQGFDTTPKAALFKVKLDLNRSLLDTVQHVQSSEQSNVPLNRNQWCRLLQPGPDRIANSEIRLNLDSMDGSVDNSNLLEESLV